MSQKALCCLLALSVRGVACGMGRSWTRVPHVPHMLHVPSDIRLGEPGSQSLSAVIADFTAPFSSLHGLVHLPIHLPIHRWVPGPSCTWLERELSYMSTPCLLPSTPNLSSTSTFDSLDRLYLGSLLQPSYYRSISAHQSPLLALSSACFAPTLLVSISILGGPGFICSCWRT